MQIKNPNSGGMKVEEPSLEPKPMNGAKIVNLGPKLKMTEALNSNNEGRFLLLLKRREISGRST